MKTGINLTIKQRIYWSFALLVFLFVVRGVISILVINRNEQLSTHLSKIVEPSLQAMEDFEDVMSQSNMYTTNCVFLKSRQEYKELLKKLHDADYPAVKARVNLYFSRWENKSW